MEASRHLEGLLKPLEHSEAEEWIERIVEGVAKRNLDSAVVDKETLVSVVQVSRRRQSLSPISCYRVAGHLVDSSLLTEIWLFPPLLPR